MSVSEVRVVWIVSHPGPLYRFQSLEYSCRLVRPVSVSVRFPVTQSQVECRPRTVTSSFETVNVCKRPSTSLGKTLFIFSTTNPPISSDGSFSLPT